MNRLKHILGINISRASSAKRSHGTASRYYSQNSKRLVSRGSKTICKQRSKTTSSAVSIKKSSTGKKSSLECATRTARRYSTYENVKFNSGNQRRTTSQNVATINTTKNINRNSSFVTSVEKRLRSYAEMIADYSEALYKGSAVGTRDDRLYPNGAIRKSPFSTSSITSLHGEVSTAGQKSDPPYSADASELYDRDCIRRDNVVEFRAFERDDTRVDESANERGNRITTKCEADRSYEKLIADYGRSVHEIPAANVLNGGSASPGNALARPSLESFATPTRRVSSANARETLRKSTSTVAVISATERSINGQVADTIDGIKRSKRDASLRKNNYYSRLYNATSDTPQYFSDAATATSDATSARKSSAQMSTSAGVAGALKRSQIELRMMPSEKESVVSIDMDSDPSGATNLLDASKQLSVVVRSDRTKDPPRSAGETQQRSASTTSRQSVKSAPAAQQRGDFGPMRISISEDSAPVKQIEFSVNGKPVSELRSITARTERLDVTSSADRIEIRIPFAKDDADVTGKSGENPVPSSKRIDSGTEQVLNVQIFANFQNRPTEGNAVRPYKAKTTDAAPVSSPQTPAIHYVFKDPGKVHSASLDGKDAKRYESSGMNIKSDGITDRNINKDRTASDAGLKIQRETANKLSADKRTTDISSVENTSNRQIGRLSARDVMDSSSYTDRSKYDKIESSDTRVPSKVVPWWSSSDCFNNIRKKEDNRKPVTTSNIHRKEAISRQNLTAESLLSGTKETSTNSSKISSKNVQSVNDTFVTNNSGNPISPSDSFGQYEESTPIVRYSCLSRLKSNRENLGTIPKTIKNDSKIQDSQISSAAKVDSEKISEMKPTRSAVLSGATSIQDKRDASIEPDTRVEKTSVLSGKLKAPIGIQDLSLERDRKDRHDHSSKRIKSIDDASGTKSRRKILDAVKPIEKKKDGTLIDYGLKVSSRKPTVKLNSGGYRIEDPFSAAAAMKEEALRKSMAEMVPKSEQIDKTKWTKQIKTDSQEERKLGAKVSEEKGKENSIVRSTGTPTIKMKDEDNVRNEVLEQARQNDAKISTDFRKSSELAQAMKKQERTAEDTINPQHNLKQHLKSPESNRSNLSGIKTSSKAMQVSEKLELSKELKKQDIPKVLSEKSAMEKIEIHRSEKIKASSELKDIRHASGESAQDEKAVDRKKSPQENTNQVKSVETNKFCSQTKPDLIPQIKDRETREKSKDAEQTSITQRSADELRKKSDAKSAIAEIVTRDSTGKGSLPNEENRPRKSKSSKSAGDSSGSTDSSRKPNGSVASSGSKTRMKSGIQSSDNTYARKLLFTESSYANFDRKDATLSKLRPAAFEVRQALNNVDGVPEDSASVTTESATLWTDMDRPEKSILYSAWLQRFTNDVNDNRLS